MAIIIDQEHNIKQFMMILIQKSQQAYNKVNAKILETHVQNCQKHNHSSISTIIAHQRNKSVK